MRDLGIVRPGSTLRIPFSSFDKDDGSSITMTNYAVADILIYKDGSTTERASTSGFTATTDFDAKTGKHLIVIDLADNTTADFFAAGSEYLVAIDAVTIDSVVTGGWVARFCIGYHGAVLNTTIATLASQTSFTLTSGPAEDDALNDMWVIIHNQASAVQWGKAVVLDYTGSTKTVTLAAGTTFTAAAKDNISVMGMAPLQPSVAGSKEVVQTGDSYAIVNSGTFGNSALKALIDAVDDFVDTEVAAIKAKTDNLPSDPADASDIAAAFSTVNSTLSTIAAYIDTEVATIITQTTADSIRSALGLTAANLDTQIDALPTNAELATALAGADDAVLAAIAALSIPTAAQNATAVLTTQMTESYRGADTAPTLAQACFELIAHMGESSISGTTKTLKKINGSTTAKTYTLNDATTPTAITETT